MADYFNQSYVTRVGSVRGRGNPPSSRAYAFALDVSLWSHRGGFKELGPHALDFSCVKSLSSPSGQWSMSFDADRAGLDPLDIEDDDWIAIAIREQYRKTNDLLTLGLVDGSRRGWKTDERNGVTTRAGRLTGRDFGKAFETHDVLFDSALQFAEPILPGLVDAAKFQTLTDLIQTGQLQAPGQTLFDLLGVLVGDDVGWFYAPNTYGVRSLANLVAVQSDVTQGNVIQLGTYVPESPQKLDPYLRSIFSTPFTEFFYDLRPTGDTTHKVDLTSSAGSFLDPFGVVPTVVFRRVPFFELDETSDAWFNLESHYVEPSEVLDEDLGRSGSERFTLFSVRAPPFAPTATLGAWGASGGKVPAFEHDKSPDSPIKGRRLSTDVARHGVRLLDVSDALAPLAGTDGQTGERVTPPAWIAQRTAGLYQLYRNTPGTIAGTIKLAHLRPEIRVGSLISYDERDFYVEQVEHAGRVDGRSGLLAGETSLTVVRGQRFDPPPTASAPRPWTSGKRK